MAQNLRAKIPKSDTLTVFDVNAASAEKFVQEAKGAPVYIAQDPTEVVRKSVSQSEAACSILL